MTDTGQTEPTWKMLNLAYGSGLNLDIAKKMLEAGVKEAEKQDMPMVIAIADAGGNLLALNRMDNAPLGSIQIAMDKAFTAVFSKMPTGDWKSEFDTGHVAPLFMHERWITFPGGFPIRRDRLLLGGIGVSGGTIEDLYVVKAALEAGGFSVDDVIRTLAPIEGTAME